MIGLLVAVALFSQEPTLTDGQARAKSRVEKLGGSFAWVQEEGAWLWCLDIDNKSKTLDFTQLKGLEDLAVLRIFHGRIDEKSLKSLRSFKKLQLLVILSDGLSDRGMKAIGDLVSLTKLDLKSGTLTSNGLVHLQRLKSLKRLFLFNTEVTDRDLEPLSKLRQLDELALPKTVSEAGLKRLAGQLPKAKVSRF